ncbi:hypothetical protein CCUS01_01489, partial [Colletotrichum cuscutae]
LEKENSAYFLYYNIKTKQLSNKLDYKKLKPFEVIKKVLLINYKLRLLNTIRYYSIFIPYYSSLY